MLEVLKKFEEEAEDESDLILEQGEDDDEENDLSKRLAGIDIGKA